MSSRAKWFNKASNGPREFTRFTVLMPHGGHQHDIYRPKDAKDEFFHRGARIAKPK